MKHGKGCTQASRGRVGAAATVALVQHDQVFTLWQGETFFAGHLVIDDPAALYSEIVNEAGPLTAN